MLIKHCLLFLIVFQFSDIIASVSPEELLIKVRSKTRLVKDFQAEADIKIDIDFLKAPVSHATIYYRSPGQVRIKSDGFSMLPKQGAGLPISSILETEYSAAALKDEMYNGKNLRVIKVIPLADTGQIIASTMWIEEATNIVHKMKITTKSGIMLMEMTYGKQYLQYALPEQVVLSFDMPKFSLPKSITGDMLTDNKPKDASKKNAVGKATITYSKYIINKGIADSHFK